MQLAPTIYTRDAADKWLSYSWCDQFNLYKTDRSLCPLCLCGSFQSLAGETVS